MYSWTQAIIPVPKSGRESCASCRLPKMFKNIADAFLLHITYVKYEIIYTFVDHFIKSCI